MKGIRYIFILIALVINVTVMAQTDRMYITAGNKLYHGGQYAKSEILYRKAIEKNPRNAQAIYNLGNALLMQKKDSLAVNQYQNASKMETNKIRLSKSFHNIGVICQAHQMYDEAIKAYEQALRNNPRDNETRYNLVLCKRLQKQNPQKKNKNKKNKDKDKDKDKDKKDKKNQNKDKDKNKDQQKKDQQKKNQMSKDNAEQLLNAAIQQEQATQERLKKAMQQPRTRQLQKNW